MERPPLFQITCTHCGNRQSVERRDCESGFDIVSCPSCAKKIKIILCGSCGTPHGVTLDAQGPERIPFTCRSCNETFMVSLSGMEKPVDAPRMPFFRATAEELLLKNPGCSPAGGQEPQSLLKQVHELVTLRAIAVSVPFAFLVTAVVQLLALQLPGYDFSRQNGWGNLMVWAARGVSATIIMIVFMVNAVILGAEERGEVNRLGIGRALTLNGFVTLVILCVNLSVSGFFLGASRFYPAWPALTVFAALVLSPFLVLSLALLLYGLAFFPVMAGERERETVSGLVSRFISAGGSKITPLAARLADFYALTVLSLVVLALIDFLIKAVLGRFFGGSDGTAHAGLHSLFRFPLETITGSGAVTRAPLRFWAGTLYAALSIALTAFFMALTSAFSRIYYRKWRDDSLTS